MITYAFLDNGSTSSFCAESLMRQLGVSGSRDQISFITLEKKDSIIDSFVVKGLTISDLGENVFIELPAMYTRPEIPVSKEDIPTQSDVNRWPHLNAVYLPEVNAVIGLLIACDVPTVFDPLEEKHSKDGGPYAKRTSIGWVVNGPLGHHRKGRCATSFFLKADPELQCMVKDFYDSGYDESSADDRPEMSQEELRFLHELESTVVLKDNRLQAEQRVHWLKKKLQRKKTTRDSWLKLLKRCLCA